MTPTTATIPSKERIKKTLNFERPDRIGIYDVFSQETIAQWKEQGLPHHEPCGDYFGHDFEIIPLAMQEPERIDTSKFVCIAIDEPFARACATRGLEETLKKMAYEARDAMKLFSHMTERIMKDASVWVERNRSTFDGVWLYGDLAYQRGLFFSLEMYQRLLYPLHKEICSYFTSYGLDILFHSDGNIHAALPSLIALGVKAVEPLQTDSGLDACKLKKEFGNDIVLFGNIAFDTLRSSRADFENEVARKIGYLGKEGGYIYRMDKEITPDMPFDDYMFALEVIKRYGVT
jgi:uroporphyrinogen decarboxylase